MSLPPVHAGFIIAEVDRRLSVVVDLETLVNANLQRATRLRQSILQRAFEGRLLAAELDQAVPTPHDLPIAAESTAVYRHST
jgi:type I restriction enzyme S subunit